VTDPVRLVAALFALGMGVAAVVVSMLVLQRTPGPVSAAPVAPAAAPVSAPAGPAFPSPPSGAVVFSREDGPDALALAVVPGKRPVGQVSVVGGQGRGVDGLSVSLGSTRATPCGPGCYRATLPSAHPRSVDVRIRGGDASMRWAVPMPATWPPPDASNLVARAGNVWRSLHSLAFFDRLGSDAAHVVVSHWVAVAPDRLAYRIPGGPSAVIVGGKRWDKMPGSRWIESPQSLPVRQPVPVWQSATDAHVVGETAKAWRVTFFDPRTPAWFDIAVDKGTLRTTDLRMITTAHFMHERYGSFDAPLAIIPPARG
jgi:hypothetical protein